MKRPIPSVTMYGEVDSYNQREREYAAKLAEYQTAEAAYREAFDHDAKDPTLPSRYEQLRRLQTEVDALYRSLSELREKVASMRDKSMLG